MKCDAERFAVTCMFYTAIVSQVASYEHVHRTNMSLDRGQHNGEPSGYFGVIVSEVEYNDNVSHYDPVDEVKASWNITQPAHLPVDGTGACYCKTELHSSYDSYVVCECYGEHLTSIPCSNFTLGVKRISIISTGIESIASGCFQDYSTSLQDIYIDSAPRLTSIANGVFHGLDKLRTVYIRQAPKLKSIPANVLTSLPSTIKVVKIIQTGLEELPVIKAHRSGTIISSIDIDSNRIRSLLTNSISTEAASVNLDYNAIEYIQNGAFNGSRIAKLSLKGNNKLTYIADDAFVGLRNLQILDLSETSIKRLPINGLQSLEILRLRDTYTLKVIPSIYNFKSIKEAHLTYAHHCCAFNFPATHDQAEVYDIFARDMKKRFCSRQQSANSMSVEQFRTNPVASLVASKQGQWFHVDAMLGHKGHRRQRRNGKQAGQLFEKSEKSAKSERRQRSKLSTPRGQQNGFHVDRQGDLDPSQDMDYGPKDKGNNSFGHIVHHVPSEAKSSKSSLDKLRSTMQTSGSDSDENDALGAPPMGFNPVIRDDQVPQSSKDSLTAHSDMDGTGYGDDSEVGYIHHYFCGEVVRPEINVKCTPEPDAFNPCEDVMGNILLRISVWVVVVAAVFGNLAVMVVLMSGRFTMSVSKFLMCNLAFADFCMGVYLLLIALVDIRTMGYYFNYAIDWQNGYGCQLAGFITVFASELSIYSLTVITLERWYAITYAIHLNKRLKLSLAIKVMLAGWVYAIAMASLPLFGVSSYARTSICLPMDISETSDAAYLYTLLSVNALAFILISACYGKMYLSIVSQQTRATVSDTTVAKRMALLVFTDFACWAPIAFFGITAMAGYPLINVTKSKILLVFFYPLNSCANPFLYAILTKQYRRDFFILTSRYGFCAQRAMKYKGTSTNCHHRVASARGNNLHPASRSTLSQGSCDGHDGSSNGPRPRVAQCPGTGCQCPKGRTRCPEDSSNCSCRSIAYSTMEANLPIESSVSGESGHDVIGRSERRGQVSGCECNSATCTRHTRKRKEKKSRIKNLQHSFSSDEDEAGNPVAIAGNAASDKSVQSSSHGHSHQCRHHHHPPTHPQQAGHRFPPSERDCGQRRWLNMDTQLDSKANCRTPRTVSCTNIHKSHKNCASWVQRESSSSGEKTSHSCNGDMDGDSGGQWSRPKEPVAVLSSVRRSQADNLGFSSQPNGLYCESIM